jgi:hypothetical protein
MIISVKTGPKKKKKNKLVLKTLLTGATLLGRHYWGDTTGIVNIKTGKYINRTYGTIESYYY